MNLVNKLVLGTAQFGMDYGVNNSRGQVTSAEVNEILTEAGKAGMHFIDTAYGYGNSEDVLGSSSALHSNEFKIISKYAAEGLSPLEQYAASLSRLKVDELYAYLVHNFPTYSEHPLIWKEFKVLKEEGLAERIGFSLYSPNELEYILEHDLCIDIVQVPYNILDRQFEQWFPVLHEKGIEVHTRSAFLQGLFFKNPVSFKGNITPLAKYVDTIQQYCNKNDIQIQDLALGYVLSSLADGVLIGVDDLNQLRNNIKSAYRVISEQDLNFIRSINVKEKELLSPVNW
jgi:aryl-alcohol dehydrogenase-like predicted oxidoreductase